MAKILNEINNILLPEVCFGCNAQLSRGEQILCVVCRHELPLTDHDYEEENALDRVFYGRIPIEKAASFLFYTKNGIVQQLLHQLKYKNQEEIGAFFGNWLGTLLQEKGELKTIDIVVPVPLHPKKQKKRGYNQVSLFAKEIARSINATYRDDVLLRTINTKTQTKKDRDLRWEKIQNAFETNPNTTPDFNTILLVDDVITTGATLEACAMKLHQLGNIKIYVLSLAMVP